MAIKFNCPHCKQALSVKDHLAGRKGPCPACKKVLTIPNPKAAPAPAAPDVEALAAAALTEEPKVAPKPQAGKTVKFNCAFCDAENEVSSELEGKQTPCVDCRRIVKVPQQVRHEPTDWRKADQRLPAGARRDVEPEPDGAWGTATSAGRVSREALLEADAIPQEKPKITAKTWAVRGSIAAAALLVVGGGAWWAMSSLAEGRQTKLVTRALEQVSPDGKEARLSPEKDAAIHRAAGEYYLNLTKSDGAAKARNHFSIARALLNKAGNGVDRDTLLIDLALTQTELGGNEDEVKKGTRLKWDDALKEIRLTLQAIGVADPAANTPRVVGFRVEGVRAVTQKLIEKGQPNVAFAVARELNADSVPKEMAWEVPEATAVAGLELLRAGKKDLAEQLGQVVLTPPPPPPQEQPPPEQPPKDPPPMDQPPKDPPEPPREGEDPKPKPPPPEPKPPAVPGLIALWVALGQPQNVDGIKSSPAAPVGFAQGAAFQGKKAEALRDIKPTTPTDQALQIYLAVASAGAPDKGPESDDLRPALDLAQKDLKEGRKVSPALLVRLAQLAAQAGQGDRVQDLANETKDTSLKGRLQLEALLAKWKNSKDKPDESLLGGFDKQGLAYFLAREALARQAARSGNSLAGDVEGWEEGQRPFGLVGTALGMQDRKR